MIIDPVGEKEIAERLGVSANRVAVWFTRGKLPAHRWTVSGAPAWNWSDIEDWKASNPKGVRFPNLDDLEATA